MVEAVKVNGKRAVFNQAGTNTQKWSDGVLEWWNTGKE
jgi:hypothetical protein